MGAAIAPTEGLLEVKHIGDSVQFLLVLTLLIWYQVCDFLLQRAGHCISSPSWAIWSLFQAPNSTLVV